MTFLEEVSAEVTYEADQMFDIWQKRLVNRDVIFLKGKFKGRKGKITAMCFNHDYNRDLHLTFLAQPYKLIRRGMVTEETTDLLWDPGEARSYLDGSYLELVDE